MEKNVARREVRRVRLWRFVLTTVIVVSLGASPFVVFRVSDALIGTQQSKAGFEARDAMSSFQPGPNATLGKSRGRLLAVIYIPKFGADWIRAVVPGTGPKVLDSQTLGVGHYPHTQLPGELGNFAVAGHRDGHGGSFGGLDELTTGDSVFVETRWGWFEYRVTSKVVVDPSHSEVLFPVPGQSGAAPSRAVMTLTTCHPRWSTAERLIVFAELEESYQRSEGRPLALYSLD